MQDMGLDGEERDLNRYVSKHVSSYVHIDEDTQDKIIRTKNVVIGELSTKNGYEVASNELPKGEKIW